MGITLYLKCARCDGAPGQLVRFADEHTEALCFACWRPLRRAAKVLDWIVGRGVRTGQLRHAPADQEGA